MAARKKLIRGDLCGDDPPQWVHDSVKRLAKQPSAAIPLPVERITPAHLRALETRGLVATWSTSRKQRVTRRGPFQEIVIEYATLTEAGQLLARKVPDPTGGLGDPEVCPDPSRTIVRDSQRAEAEERKRKAAVKRKKLASPGSTTGVPGGSSAA